MQFHFWEIKMLWWEILAVGVLMALIIRYFMRSKKAKL
jgi:uncharacterized membrane protein YbaN (DUF454 family)